MSLTSHPIKLALAMALVFAPLLAISQQTELSKPATPTIELLEEMPVEPEVYIEEIERTTVTVAPEPDSSAIAKAGVPFPSVKEQSSVSWNSGNQFAGRARPALGVWEPGDVPGTEIMRLSDADGNGLHFYSSRQVWNADMTKVMVGNGGVDENRVLDATNNFALLPNRVPLNSNRVWSNTNPDLIYGMLGKTVFASFNVTTGITTPIYTDKSTINMKSKMNIPGDDSKVVFYRPSENRIISYDIKNRKILGTLVWPTGNLNSGGGHVAYDWSGKWVTVLPSSSAGGKYLHRLAPDLTGSTIISREPGHSDMAYNTSGESVQVVTLRNGRVAVANYDDPDAYYTSPTLVHPNPNQSDSRQPFYISGRGQLGSPGWVLLSGEVGDGSPNFPLTLYKVDGNTTKGTIKVVGYDHHSGAGATDFVSSNDDKQKGSHSTDGNAISFTSDWGAPGQLSTYIIRDSSSN